MSNESIKVEIKTELISHLDKLSYDELKKQTKKKCKAYLEQKFNISMSKYKSHIKLCLSQFITNYVKSKNNTPTKTSNTNTITTTTLTKTCNNKSNTSNTSNNTAKLTSKSKNNTPNKISNTTNITTTTPTKTCNNKSNTSNNTAKLTSKTKNVPNITTIIPTKPSNDKSNTSNISNTRKRKINECMDSITEPPYKKLKQCPLPKDNIKVQSPKTDDYKEKEIIQIDKNEKDNTSEKLESKCISNNIQSIDNMKEMTSLIYAENLMYSLNEQLTSMKDNEKDKENINYDNIEYDALKNKLMKCSEECVKYKELVKKYAGLLQPKIVMCNELKKENEILNKNIEILKNNHVKEMDKLKNCVKNESENVKEERFKCLRKDKYIQRLQKKFDFICNKYNIDKDSVVIEMNQ